MINCNNDKEGIAITREPHSGTCQNCKHIKKDLHYISWGGFVRGELCFNCLEHLLNEIEDCFVQ